jgi:hypothetical protein
MVERIRTVVYTLPKNTDKMTMEGNGAKTLNEANTTGKNGTSSIKLPGKAPNPTNGHRNPQDPLTLPPGISSDDFHNFIARARKICGEENVTIVSDLAQLSHEHYTEYVIREGRMS